MAIDKLFREAGITIAFPQRDVHFDASGPVPVQVVSEEKTTQTTEVPSKSGESDESDEENSSV